MKSFFLFLSLFLIIQSVAWSRYVKEEEVSFSVEHVYVDVKVNEDGTFTEATDLALRIIKKEAIEKFGTYKLQYSFDSEEIKVLEAYVDNDGTKTTVSPSNIQKNTLAASSQFVMNEVEIAIIFPQLKENSIIHLKYANTSKKNILSKLYSSFYEYGETTVEYDSRLKIQSPSKLFYKIQDPYKKLTVKEDKDKSGNNIIEVSMKGPFVRALTEEFGSLSEEERTFVKISSVNDWNKFAQELSAKTYENIVKQLPEELNKLVAALPKNYGFEEKVNYFLSYIVKNYRYTGDIRSISGRMFPKKLDILIRDKFGDCKDFSNLLVNLLSAAHIRADYVLINRSLAPKSLKTDDLPYAGAFNHMIVRVQNENDIFWIDPTNALSVGTLIRKDISDRLALNLNLSLPRLEEVKSKESSAGISTYSKEYNFTSANDATVLFSIRSTGESSYMLQDLFKDKPSSEFENTIMKGIAIGENNVVKEFKSNADFLKYKNLEIKGKYVVNQFGKNEKGRSAELRLPDSVTLAPLFFINKASEGLVDLSVLPDTQQQSIFYKNIFMLGELPEVCDIKTDWIVASRKIDLVKEGIQLNDSINFIKKKLTKDLYQSDSFGITLNNLKKCFIRNKIDYEYGINEHKVSSSDFEKEIANLPLNERLEKRYIRARKALEGVDTKKEPGLTVESARILITKNISEEPMHAKSLALMATYYLTANYKSDDTYEKNSLEQALGYLNRAIAADPNRVSAKVLKAKVYFYMKDLSSFQESIEGLQHVDKEKLDSFSLNRLADLYYMFGNIKGGLDLKQMALTKSTTDDDRYDSYTGLGDGYKKMKNYKGCVDNYLQALSIDGEHAWDYGSVSPCYMKLGQYDQAISIMKKGLSIMNYGVGRMTLGNAYLLKGRALVKDKKYAEAEKSYTESLLNNEDSMIYLELIKVHMNLNDQENAIRDANKFVELFEGDPNVITDYLAQSFDIEHSNYSELMEKTLSGIKNESKVGQISYYIAYKLSQKGKKKECGLWIQKGLKAISSSLEKKSNSEEINLDNYITETNFHLLHLWTFKELAQLEYANKSFKKALSLDSENKKVITLKKYLDSANHTYNRDSVTWKAKMFLNNMNIPIPDWMAEI